MQVLHAHYSPDQPGLTFWVESSDVPAPKPQRGRVLENPITSIALLCRFDVSVRLQYQDGQLKRRRCPSHRSIVGDWTV
jgi:hypothetical protein